MDNSWALDAPCLRSGEGGAQRVDAHHRAKAHTRRTDEWTRVSMRAPALSPLRSPRVRPAGASGFARRRPGAPRWHRAGASLRGACAPLATRGEGEITEHVWGKQASRLPAAWAHALGFLGGRVTHPSMCHSLSTPGHSPGACARPPGRRKKACHFTLFWRRCRPWPRPSSQRLAPSFFGLMAER